MTNESLQQFFARCEAERQFPLALRERRHLAWRMLLADQQVPGSIRGLDAASRGVARATNGVLLIIERWDCSLFVGHIASWCADKAEHERALGHGCAKAGKPATKRARAQSALQALLDGIE